MRRLGSALNAHTHQHLCVTDGVFSLKPHGTLRFHPAVDLQAAAVSAARIEAADRRGLELLLRYCVRPAFASERLA